MRNRVVSQATPGFSRILFLLWCAVALMVYAATPGAASTQSVTLAWDANTEPDFARRDALRHNFTSRKIECDIR